MTASVSLSREQMLATLELLGWVQCHLVFVKPLPSGKDVMWIDVADRDIRRRPALHHMQPPAPISVSELRLVYDAVIAYEGR